MTGSLLRENFRRLGRAVSPRRGALCLLLVVFGGFTATVAASDSSPAQLLPNDPGFRTFPDPLQQIRAPEAWAAAPCQGVVIAVLDTGVTPIADLAGRVLPGWNVAAGNADTTDDKGHGTWVASVAAAAVNNGIGTAGICGGAQILPVKVSDSAGVIKADWVIEGINWAMQHGAKVINVSLSLPPGASYQPGNDAINNAVARGTTVVLIAGNDGRNDTLANTLASGSPQAVRVAGVDLNGQIATLSNRGTWVDIAAPYEMPVSNLDGSSGTYRGTSFSAPAVAGAAAQLLAFNPGLTPAQVKDYLMRSGTKVSGLDVACGCVLNVYGALEAAGYKPPTVTTSTQPSTTTVTAPKTYRLKLVVKGKGSVSCTPSCTTPLPAATRILVTAKPRAGSRLTGWSGACARVRAPTCRLVLQGNLRLTARFTTIKRR